jgi:hypothetical protein
MKSSDVGRALSRNKWLPDKNGRFRSPGEIKLTQIHPQLENQSSEARELSEKLGFKPDVEQELIDQLPKDEQRLYTVLRRVFSQIPPGKTERFIRDLEKMAKGLSTNIPDDTNVISREFSKALLKEGSRMPEEGASSRWSGVSPEDLETIGEDYGQDFSKRIKNMKMSREVRIQRISRSADRDNVKQYLLTQYQGHCQICNTKLELGMDRDPYFEIYRIVETRGKYVWSDLDGNTLCLCPNCHALAKHGGRDFNSIIEMAKSVIEGAVAPEPVAERNGDYFIVDIRIAGEDAELYYSPNHMAKLAVFYRHIYENSDEE